MLGMNLLLWTAKVTPDHGPLLRDLREIGYTSVEVPLFDPDLAQARDLGRLLDGIGLRRTGLAALGADDNPVSADPAVRDLARQNGRKAVDAAAALGARMLVGPFHSGFGVHSGQGPTPDEWKRSIDFVGELADYAAAQDVALSLEFLNRFECYLVNTTADTARLVAEVGRPNVGILYDTHHANIEDPDIAETIRTYSPAINHVHLSESHRGTPGRGQVDWKATIRALGSAGYGGACVVEAFGTAVPELIPLVKVWRRCFETELGLAREAHAFLAPMLAAAKLGGSQARAA